MTAYSIRFDPQPPEPLLSVIESLWPVKFEASGPAAAVAAAVVADGAAVPPGCPLVLVAPAAAAAAELPAPADEEVCFSDDPDVPWPFRGRVVRTRLQRAVPGLAPRPGERVLACDRQGRALWTVGTAGAGRVFRTALPWAAADAAQGAPWGAGGERFVQVLPLFHLVREACGADDWQPAPLRASYIVDDPNLHWPRYGYLDYEAVAQDAGRENYHVGFATIPLDAWFTHPGAAGLFRRHRSRLSLLIHGNDHGKNELAHPRTALEHAALLKQAVARIASIEARFGLQVCRVMVPPHGACSEDTLRQLPLNGFEAACISAGSLRAHNRGREWTHAVGFAPCEMVEGCPVLPRWALTTTGEDVLLAAAYLGQPLVLRAHHQDFRKGLDAFAQPARFINSLGPVKWGHMTELSRMAYRWRREGRACRVQLLSNLISFEVPHGVEQVVVDGEATRFRLRSPAGRSARLDERNELVLPVKAGERLDIERLSPALPLAAATGLTHRTSTGLVLRRLLSEARDRLLAF